MKASNLNSLRMFEAAARHENFRLAAEELHLTQGAVAQRIRQLEEELGRKLFLRRPRGLELTVVGQAYYGSIAQALGLIDAATQKLRPEKARISLSVTPSFASKWLVPRLSLFSQIHPQIDVQIVASEHLSDFESDGVDVAIRQGRPPFQSGVEAVLLAPLGLCAVSSPLIASEFPVFHDEAEFLNHPLIEDSHAHWRSLLGARMGDECRVMRFNQTALAMDAAANGQGIALAPRILIENDVEAKRLEVLWRDERISAYGFYVVYPKGQRENTARTAMVNWILSQSQSSIQ
ncbi:LysR substrate-binding domain-containing protein [Pseudovibrio sp. Tun.PSC04-5.I4]|uniref:LysR substrate-binding domain-containing protein n=1 Tax=Pseudovibrio sp. Tun.PSC04-5.I4 TaxID=1798213 RepID=UPI000890EBD8|nr:LysR substrate-binding domain-containing protein [Pseudovibrio sp. Tun.PSC04-5.I4]SDR29621.1 LysR family transcriptional regulator, glycine cleavage system transcriptional activator [Pseudovibrio sp. Tun.PSC04-5.I4]